MAERLKRRFPQLEKKWMYVLWMETVSCLPGFGKLLINHIAYYFLLSHDIWWGGQLWKSAFRLRWKITRTGCYYSGRGSRLKWAWAPSSAWERCGSRLRIYRRTVCRSRSDTERADGGSMGSRNGHEGKGAIAWRISLFSWRFNSLHIFAPCTRETTDSSSLRKKR